MANECVLHLIIHIIAVGLYLRFTRVYMLHINSVCTESVSYSLAMEDSFVALMNDTLVTSQAGGCAECASTDTTGKLWR